MSKVSEMTRDSWIKATFPEWGTWLVEDIENEVVPEGNVAMWWLGCTGIWMKTPGGANITIDLWCGNGKRTHGDNKMKPGHQMANMTGGRLNAAEPAQHPVCIRPVRIQAGRRGSSHALSSRSHERGMGRPCHQQRHDNHRRKRQYDPCSLHRPEEVG